MNIVIIIVLVSARDAPQLCRYLFEQQQGQ